MGIKKSVPKFWDLEWEWKTEFKTFGNGNEKQWSVTKLGNSGDSGVLGKKLGTGFPAHVWFIFREFKEKPSILYLPLFRSYGGWTDRHISPS